MNKITFEKIKGTDCQIATLFNQLKSRNYGISHQLLPEYQDHITFVKNHPYRYWALVLEGNSSLGSVYLQFNNSIGFNLLKPRKKVVFEILAHIRDNFEPENEVKSSIPPYFYVNVASKNEELAQIFSEVGAVPIQTSYKL